MKNVKRRQGKGLCFSGKRGFILLEERPREVMLMCGCVLPARNRSAISHWNAATMRHVLITQLQSWGGGGRKGLKECGSDGLGMEIDAACGPAAQLCRAYSLLETQNRAEVSQVLSKKWSLTRKITSHQINPSGAIKKYSFCVITNASISPKGKETEK